MNPEIFEELIHRGWRYGDDRRLNLRILFMAIGKKKKMLSLRLSVHPLFKSLGCLLKIRTTEMSHKIIPGKWASHFLHCLSKPENEVQEGHAQVTDVESGERSTMLWGCRVACSSWKCSTKGWIDSTEPSDCLREHRTIGTASTGYQDPFSLNDKQVGAGACFRDERRHGSVSWAKQIIHYTHLLFSEPFFCLCPCPL